MNKAVKRNLYVMLKNYMFNIIFAIVSIPIWGITYNQIGGIVFAVPIMTYVSFSILEQYEELYNYDRILNSLPISRVDIVEAKFKSMFIIYLINTVFTVVVDLVYSMMGLKEFITANMYILGISMSFLLAMAYGAVGISIVCKFGYNKLKIFGFFIIMIAMIVINIIIFILQQNNYTILISSAILIFLGIVLYFVCKRYTVKNYLNKEF